MKKFLTVLLVIAVMFTFSFGSAFAATGVTGSAAKTHYEAMTKAVEELNEEFAAIVKAGKLALADTYKADDIYVGVLTGTIDKSVYEGTMDKMATDFAAIVNAAADVVDTQDAYKESTDVEALKTAIKGTEVKGILTAADVKEIALQAGWYLGIADLEDYVTYSGHATELQNYYTVYTWANALPGFKTELNAALATIDMSVYTDDVIDANAAYPQTWAEKAEEIKAEVEKKVADTTVTLNMTREDAFSALWGMFNKVCSNIKVAETVEYVDGTVIVVSYKLADASLKTAEDLEGDKVVTEAEKASLKAAIAAQAAAEYKWALGKYNDDMAKATTTDAKEEAKATFESRKEAYEAFEEVNNLLVDEEKVTSEAQFVEPWTAKSRIATYEAAEKLAAALKLEVEKEGSTKYDAAVIAEILEDLQVRIYNGGAAATEADFAKALIAVDHLNWEKELLLADIDMAKKAMLKNKFYDPEAEKVEAIYAEAAAKVEAVENAKQLTEVKKDVIAKANAAADKIDTKAEVQTKLTPYLNTQKFEQAVESYLGYLNMAATSADGKRVATVETADVVKYLAGEGARTNADVAGYLAQAEAYAQSVKTAGEIKAEKIAVDELIKALPNIITLEDKAAVKAAWEAADDAGYRTTDAKLVSTVKAVAAAEDKAIDEMIKALPAKLTAADKEAVYAILDAIEAYNDEEMYTADYSASQTEKAENAFKAVRAAVLADVHAAIAAIDVEDAESVEAARAAVDAFVAEYTDAYAADKVDGVRHGYHAIDYIKNIDKLTYAEAQVALAKIEAVEALKITAKSSAKKGSITVKWTVKGDTSAVEGYEIWKSTKHSSGYKKAFTTEKMSYKNTKGLKKGTRYYYKVRAIAYVEGEKITSDWSNKARRIAK